MSKSLGNGIDPLEVIDKYGADALRLTLMTGNAPGNDMRFYWERVESSRNFANKIWNASRFVLMNLEGKDVTEPEIGSLCAEDKWILSRLNNVIKEVTDNMDKYTPELLDLGMGAMIGKGKRSQEVIDAVVRNKAVYFAAVGGACALLSKCITSSEIVAYEDLGTEAIRKLTVVNLPVIVVIDSKGNNLYETAVKEYRKI